MDAAQLRYPVGVLVHVPIPIDAGPLEQTYHEWFPFLEKVAGHTREHVDQILAQIWRGAIILHLAYDEDEKKTVAIAGSMIFLQGEDRIGRIVWTAGLDRKRWLALFPVFEKYHKEHLRCVGMEAIARRGWLKDLKANGYRFTRVLVEKRL